MKIYDFLSKQEKKIINSDLKIYLCGPTVYDHIHIGNARSLIIYDVLIKSLNILNIKYSYLINITDIDDKIISKAIKTKKSEIEISNFYLNEFLKVFENLHLTKPTLFPKVSDNINEMIKFIENLINKKVAYVENGDVYFSVKKIKNYGDLVNLKMDQLETEQISNVLKHDPKDFTLWKKTDKGINYLSPWSKGRPGWHTECALFNYNFFQGKTIDLHCGGIDLRFPHHTNEKAQYETLTNKAMSKIWSYVGHVTIEKNKMSKSLNNDIKVKNFVKENSSNILKNIFYSINYTKPINIDLNVIETSKQEILKWETKISNLYKNLILSDFKYQDEKLKSIEKKNAKLFLESNLDTTNLKTILSKNLLINSTLTRRDIESSFYNILSILNILGFDYKFNTNVNQLEKFKKETLAKNYEFTDRFRGRLFNIK